jgi:hypothetical protein
MVVARTIAGVLKDSSGTLLTNKRIRFTPEKPFGSGGVMVGTKTETIYTDPTTAAYSVDLFTKSDEAINYKCEIGKDIFAFALASGATTSIDALRT